MRKYVIERDIPGIEGLCGEKLKQGAANSNEALAKLAPRVQWLESFITKDKTFCIYLAEGEEAVREHACLSGFPASRINEVARVIDPITGT
jgi:hypothetical protein